MNKSQEYYQKNKEKIKARVHKYYIENKEKCNKQSTLRHKLNKSVHNLLFNKYRKKRYQIDEKWRNNRKIGSASRHKYLPIKCLLCNSKEKLILHHYTQPYEIDKVYPICTKCHKAIHKGEIVINLPTQNNLDGYIQLKEKRQKKRGCGKIMEMKNGCNFCYEDNLCLSCQKKSRGKK